MLSLRCIYKSILYMENRIKEVLKEKGITAVEFSENVGLSKVTLYNIMNGKQEASTNTLKLIADKLNIPFWELFVSPEEVAKRVCAPDAKRCPHCGGFIEVATITEIKPL